MSALTSDAFYSIKMTTPLDAKGQALASQLADKIESCGLVYVCWIKRRVASVCTLAKKFRYKCSGRSFSMITMTCTSSSIDGLQMMQQNQIIMLVVLLILNLGDHTNGDAHGQLPAISTPNLAA